jgi:hypothetical protein
VTTYTPDEFARILEKAPVKAAKDVVKAANKGALNVKNEARSSVQRTAPVHNAHAADFINYDVSGLGSTVSAEIGYDKDKGKRAGKRTGPGGIGNLLEFGGGKDHSPPHHDLRRALEAEEPRWVNAVGDAGEKAID